MAGEAKSGSGSGQMAGRRYVLAPLGCKLGLFWLLQILHQTPPSSHMWVVEYPKNALECRLANNGMLTSGNCTDFLLEKFF